jgi:tRNA (guanine-N7-)-methyltransferase
MEIKYKRLFKTAEKTLKNDNNDFILLKDFGQNIDKIFDKEEIETTYIFFPDPWPKDRHAKHRIMQEEFLEKLYNITES